MIQKKKLLYKITYLSSQPEDESISEISKLDRLIVASIITVSNYHTKK